MQAVLDSTGGYQFQVYDANSSIPLTDLTAAHTYRQRDHTP